MKLPCRTPRRAKKQFIEFEGVNHIASVSLNGKALGCHKGGFSTFRYELTEHMKPTDNLLCVDVTNEECDVYPQMADFTFFGGIYRGCAFLEVEPAHFDLLKAGTDAVFVTGNPAGKTRVDAFSVDAEGCTVKVTVTDTAGCVAATGMAPASEHTVVELNVSEPHLWNGLDDPYLYTATAQLCRGEQLLDEVTVHYGYRTFHVDPASGFYFNGKSVPLRGVSRHQDRIHKGWAIDKEEHEEDLRLILEVGASVTVPPMNAASSCIPISPP